jgi:hypothetical protein
MNPPSQTRPNRRFSYAPIADGFVRLVRLHRHREGAPLACDISTHTFEEAEVVDYTAISYAW